MIYVSSLSLHMLIAFTMASGVLLDDLCYHRTIARVITWPLYPGWENSFPESIPSRTCYDSMYPTWTYHMAICKRFLAQWCLISLNELIEQLRMKKSYSQVTEALSLSSILWYRSHSKSVTYHSLFFISIPIFQTLILWRVFLDSWCSVQNKTSYLMPETWKNSQTTYSKVSALGHRALAEVEWQRGCKSVTDASYSPSQERLLLDRPLSHHHLLMF